MIEYIIENWVTFHFVAGLVAYLINFLIENLVSDQMFSQIYNDPIEKVREQRKTYFTIFGIGMTVIIGYLSLLFVTIKVLIPFVWYLISYEITLYDSRDKNNETKVK